MTSEKLDIGQAIEYYYSVQPGFSESEFSQQTEQTEERYNNALREYLKTALDNGEDLLNLDIEVGRLVRSYEQKGFLVGLMCAGMFNRQPAATTEPKLFDKPETVKGRTINGIDLKTGRRCRFITIDGVTQNVSRWCKEAKVYGTVAYSYLNKSEEDFIAYIRSRMAVLA